MFQNEPQVSFFTWAVVQALTFPCSTGETTNWKGSRVRVGDLVEVQFCYRAHKAKESGWEVKLVFNALLVFDDTIARVSIPYFEKLRISLTVVVVYAQAGNPAQNPEDEGHDSYGKGNASASSRRN